MNAPVQRYSAPHLYFIDPGDAPKSTTRPVVLASDYDQATQTITQLTDELNQLRLEHEWMLKMARRVAEAVNGHSCTCSGCREEEEFANRFLTISQHKQAPPVASPTSSLLGSRNTP